MKNIISILLLVLISWSCEDQLIRTPKDFLSPSGFESKKDVVHALNGTYKALTGMGMSGLDGQNIEPVITDFITDNGFMDKSWMGIVEYWDQRHNPFSQFSERKWARNYAGILRANTILKYMSNVPLSSEDAKLYNAEARFLRAYFYADLVHFYGDVPLRLEPDGIENQDIVRTPQNEIIQFIYSELDSAIAALPPPYETEPGRATKSAAQALKAWVALNHYEYSITNDLCEEIILDGHHSLYHDYAGLFKPENENNSEIIFDIQYSMDKTDERLTEPFTTYFYAWSSFMADYSLANAYYTKDGLPADATNPNFNPQKPFLDRDPRMGFTLALPYHFNGFANDGDTLFYTPYVKRAFNFSSLRINKYVDYEVSHGRRGHKSTGTNVILFRYADVLLMKAEALCMEEGNSAEAEIISLVNEVRQRQSVMMPIVEEVEGTGLDQDKLLDIIKHERRVEFAFEGTRILDIKRWQIGEEAYTDAMGYDPNFLYYWVVNDENIATMESDGIIPSSMMRYLKRENYFLNKIFKTEDAFQVQMESVFTPENGFRDNELEDYGDVIIEYVQPKYVVYSYRQRNFDAIKGYLWPLPYAEMESNKLITDNNPGY